MDRVTIEKKTVEEAINEALLILKVPREDVHVEVLEEGAKGFLGIGSKEAKVVVTKKSALSLYEVNTPKKETFEDKIDNLKEDAKEEVEDLKDTLEEGYSEFKEDAKDAFEKIKDEASHIKDEIEDFVSEKTEDAKEFIERKKEESKPKKKSSMKKPLHEDEIFTDEDEAAEKTRVFLENLIKKMGYNGEVKLLESDDEDTFTLDIVPEEYKLNSRFIGKKGDTLSAIGYITSIYLSNRYMDDLRVEVDCGDYIYQKKEDIKSFAKTAAQKALRDGRYEFRPMTAYDRRIVHKTVNEIEGLQTFSEGEEPKRHVVIVKDPQ